MRPDLLPILLLIFSIVSTAFQETSVSRCHAKLSRKPKKIFERWPARIFNTKTGRAFTVHMADSFTGGDMDKSFKPKSAKAVLDRIDELVQEAPIVLFMKGNPAFPQCGFSSTCVQILDRLSLKYTSHDVLADDVLRQGIKDYSQWPTIPQLYLCGEFIGGSDIVLELYQSGELLEMIEIAAASS